MKTLIKSTHFAIYILLTCVLCVGCGLKSDIESVNYKRMALDSLQVEFSNVSKMHDKHCDIFKIYNTKKDIDKMMEHHDSCRYYLRRMIETNNEIMRVRYAR